MVTAVFGACWRRPPGMRSFFSFLRKKSENAVRASDFSVRAECSGLLAGDAPPPGAAPGRSSSSSSFAYTLGEAERNRDATLNRRWKASVVVLPTIDRAEKSIGFSVDVACSSAVWETMGDNQDVLNCAFSCREYRPGNVVCRKMQVRTALSYFCLSSCALNIFTVIFRCICVDPARFSLLRALPPPLVGEPAFLKPVLLPGVPPAPALSFEPPAPAPPPPDIRSAALGFSLSFARCSRFAFRCCEYIM
mmetsp:Transcript_28459/g.72212  ORF Transcript_28459/g.72212 Transcript_28459/m.72212 type:complete len:249 (-) Transcript_28459:2012-2758(-)